MPSDFENGGDLSIGKGLENKVVVVTGASSGIGRATALLFERVGARVCATARDEEGLESLAKEMQDSSRHLFLTVDLENSKECEGIVTRTLDHFGEMLVLAHIAGALRRKPLYEVTEEDWDYQLNVNLRAGFFLNRAAGKAMIEREIPGRIINFTSTSWMMGPLFGSDAYVAAKGGVVSMTRGFARQFGPQGIRVNAIAPGQVNTPMQHVDNSPEMVAATAAASPLGRMGEPEELARVAVFLASDNASFIHGATINVSGGTLLY
ncbi:MAG: SDR family oxidoreductase [Candidatus Nanopelagicaceae bacterium]|jgi:NAD(P)-dependent dehydrogenase (short-subunit alcohol dehydrogenase family)